MSGLPRWDTWPGDPLAIYFSSWSFSKLASDVVFQTEPAVQGLFLHVNTRLSQITFVVHITKETSIWKKIRSAYHWAHFELTLSYFYSFFISLKRFKNCLVCKVGVKSGTRVFNLTQLQ